MTERPVAEVRGFPRPDGGRLDLVLATGETVALAGPNGSGKTSLLRCLAGLDAPLRPASVRLGRDDPRRLPATVLAERVAFVTQDPRDGLVGLTVSGEARMRRLPPDPELSPLRDRDVATLSSGEARHVALRTALASPAPVLLLDEPMEGLDARHLDALRSTLRDTDRTVVFVDHDGALADLADRTVALGPSGGHRWPSLPQPEGAPRLTAPAHTARRGERDIPLPALALGPGGHAVVGPNGSGKSTLLRHLAGLDGEGPQVDGRPAVPGKTARLLLPHAREMFLGDTVTEELDPCDPETRRRLVPEALLERHPLTLSGGEAQRVALAKALGQEAAVYLLDEPDAHLDAAGRAALAECLRTRIEAGACVVAATHDEELAAALGRRTSLEGPP